MIHTRGSILTVLVTIALFSNTQASFTSIENEIEKKTQSRLVNETISDTPEIVIHKSISDTTPKRNQTIRVDIEVFNYGNHSAYDLDVSDPRYYEWGFVEEYYITQPYVLLETNSGFRYWYNIIPQKSGNYTLEPSIIVYYDENNTQFLAMSNWIELFVEITIIEDSTTKEWFIVLGMSMLIVTILGISTLLIPQRFKYKETKKS